MAKNDTKLSQSDSISFLVERNCASFGLVQMVQESWLSKQYIVGLSPPINQQLKTTSINSRSKFYFLKIPSYTKIAFAKFFFLLKSTFENCLMQQQAPRSPKTIPEQQPCRSQRNGQNVLFFFFFFWIFPSN